ncbi:unnamed protein product [Durusdinium trenchii]|uniref:Uncharacterized protein n=1 Tax=Durusdinium trenchii TaxID=1381693 RepID=A0ABP0QHB7_9DINO
MESTLGFLPTPKRPELPTDLSLLEASSQVEEGDRSIGCTMEEMVLPSFESFRSWEVPLSGEPPRMPNRMLHEYHLYRLRGALTRIDRKRGAFAKEIYSCRGEEAPTTPWSSWALDIKRKFTALLA